MSEHKQNDAGRGRGQASARRGRGQSRQRAGRGRGRGQPKGSQGQPTQPEQASKKVRVRSVLGHAMYCLDGGEDRSNWVEVSYPVSVESLRWLKERVFHCPVKCMDPIPEQNLSQRHGTYAVVRKALEADLFYKCVGRKVLYVNGDPRRVSQLLQHAGHHRPQLVWHQFVSWSQEPEREADQRAWFAKLTAPLIGDELVFPGSAEVDDNAYDVLLYGKEWWLAPESESRRIAAFLARGCPVYVLSLYLPNTQEGRVWGGEVSWHTENGDRTIVVGDKAYPESRVGFTWGRCTVTVGGRPWVARSFCGFGDRNFGVGVWRIEGAAPALVGLQAVMDPDAVGDWAECTWTVAVYQGVEGIVQFRMGTRQKSVRLPMTVVNQVAAHAEGTRKRDTMWVESVIGQTRLRLEERGTGIASQSLVNDIASYVISRMRGGLDVARQLSEERATAGLIAGEYAHIGAVSVSRTAVALAGFLTFVVAIRLGKYRLALTSLFASFASMAVRPASLFTEDSEVHPTRPGVTSFRTAQGMLWAAGYPLPGTPWGVWSHGPLAFPTVCFGARHNQVVYQDGDVWRIEGSSGWISRIHGALHQPKIGPVQCGPAAACLTPTVASNCICNHVTSLVERVLRATPEPDPEWWVDTVRIMKRRLPWAKGFPPVVVPVSTWIARYTQAKARPLEEAMVDWGRPPGLLNKHFVIKGFCKRELILKGSDTNGVPNFYAPRWISPPTSVLKVAMGPESHACTKAVGAMFDGELLPGSLGAVLYVSGWNATDIGRCTQRHYERISFWGPVGAISGDFVKYDLHNSKVAQQGMHALWRHGKVSARFLRLLRRRIRTVGVTFATGERLRYFRQDTRKSGDEITSGENSFEAIVIWLRALFEVEEFCKQQLCDFPWFLCDNGDDAFVLAPAAFCAMIQVAFKRHCQRSGFAEESKITTLERLTFCSSRFVPTKEGWVLTPKLGRVLAKRFWSVTAGPGPESRRWLRSVTQPMLMDMNHMEPARLLAEFVWQRVRTERRWKLKDPSEEYQFHTSLHHHADEKTQQWFRSVYGLELDEASHAVFQVLQRAEGVVFTYSHPCLDHIIRVDTAEFFHPPMNKGSLWSDVLGALIIAPPLEEFIKHSHPDKPASALGFGVAEYVLHVLAGANPVSRISPVIMHAATGFMSYGTGVAVHFAWNLAAVLGIHLPPNLNVLNVLPFSWSVFKMSEVWPKLVKYVEGSWKDPAFWLHVLEAHAESLVLGLIACGAKVDKYVSGGASRVGRSVTRYVQPGDSNGAKGQLIDWTAAMPKVKAKRSKQGPAAKPKAKPKVVNPEVKGGGRLFAVEPGGNLQLQAERMGLHNAAIFVESMLSPYSTDAQRVPDAFSATGLAKGIQRKTLTRVADSVTTSVYWGLKLVPCLKGQYKEISAAASGALTWGGASDNPWYTQYAANYYYARCVGMSMIIHDPGEWLSQHATVYWGLVPYTVDPPNLATLGDQPRTVVMASTDKAIRDTPVEIPWLPMTWSTALIADAPGTSFPTGLGFHVLTDPVVEDQCLVLIIEGDDTSTDIFQIDITSKWEFIPIWTNWGIINPLMAVGTISDVARVVQELLIMDTTEDPGRYTWQVRARKNIRTVLANVTGGGSFGSFIKKVGRGIRNAARGAYDVAQHVVKGGQALAGAGYLAPHHAKLDRLPRESVTALHLMMIGLGAVENSPIFSEVSAAVTMAAIAEGKTLNDIAGDLTGLSTDKATLEDLRELEEVKSYSSTPGQLPHSTRTMWLPVKPRRKDSA